MDDRIKYAFKINNRGTSEIKKWLVDNLGDIIDRPSWMSTKSEFWNMQLVSVDDSYTGDMTLLITVYFENIEQTTLFILAFSDRYEPVYE